MDEQMRRYFALDLFTEIWNLFVYLIRPRTVFTNDQESKTKNVFMLFLFSIRKVASLRVLSLSNLNRSVLF